MSKTARGLTEHCKKALSNNVQYVYGAKMEVLTITQIQYLQSLYGKGCVWDSDLKKAGKLCCDCSGLISSYTGVVRSSSGYEATSTIKYGIEVLKNAEKRGSWSEYVGWGLWMKGHIGVVSDTPGYYYAMDGSARNMVHMRLNMQGWTHIIKLKDIDYTGGEKMQVKTYDEAMKVLTEKGVISTREYWDNAVKCVKYLEDLIINMANKL